VHDNDDNSRKPNWFRDYELKSEQWRAVTDAQIKNLQDQMDVLMLPYRKALTAIKWSGVAITGGIIAEAIHRIWDFITRHIR
jgi:hypothetical protein